jgi:muramoyltetrapeptide carboxypeptidase
LERAFQGSLFGHVTDQFSLPVGVRAEIDAAAGTIRMLEPVVA